MAAPAELRPMLPNRGNRPYSPRSDASLPVDPAFTKDAFIATGEELAIGKSNAARKPPSRGTPRSTTQRRKVFMTEAKAALYSRAAKASLQAHFDLNTRLSARSIKRRHPLAHEVIELELVKRYLNYERDNPKAPANPLDPCAGKHGFKRRKCKFTHAGFFKKVKKIKGKAWDYAKHHKGEIALSVGLAVGGLALEAVTLGGATPAVAGAVAAANVASKAGTAVKIGQGALKLAEGAKTVEKVAKGAQMAEKVAEGAQTAQKLAKGAKVAEEAAQAAKKVEGIGKAANSVEHVAEGAKAAENVGEAAKAANMGKNVPHATGAVQPADTTGTAAKAAEEAPSRFGKMKKWGSNGYATVKQETKNQVNMQIQQGIINKAVGMGSKAPNAAPKVDGAPGGPSVGDHPGPGVPHGLPGVPHSLPGVPHGLPGAHH